MIHTAHLHAMANSMRHRQQQRHMQQHHETMLKHQREAAKKAKEKQNESALDEMSKLA